MATAANSKTTPTKIPTSSIGDRKTPGGSSKPKIGEVPMNKIVVGLTPSPNLTKVKSKIGSMDNIKHRPGGGHVKMESKKVDFSAARSKVGSVDNMTHKPGGGDKKVQSKKLEWKASSKIGSLDNATHKPGGGDKKIESVKLDFKDKAKSKVGSKDNVKHMPGGGKVQSPVSSPPPTHEEPNLLSEEDGGVTNKQQPISAEAEQ